MLALIAPSWHSQEHTRPERSRRMCLNVGVRHFIGLTEFGELIPYEAILSEESRSANITATFQRFPIRDVSVPRNAVHLGEILLTIDRRIREGGAVFVHCWGGVGRTGLVVGCWLQEHGRTNTSGPWKSHLLRTPLI